MLKWTLHPSKEGLQATNGFDRQFFLVDYHLCRVTIDRIKIAEADRGKPIALFSIPPGKALHVFAGCYSSVAAAAQAAEAITEQDVDEFER